MRQVTGRVLSAAIAGVMVLCGGATLATEAVEVEVEVYRGPVIKRIPYQKARMVEADSRQRDGTVELDMMVDPRGRTYELAVVQSSGVVEIDDAAVQYFKETTFEPARIGRKTVHSGVRTRFVYFSSASRLGPRPEFQRAHAALLQALEGGDRAEADRLLSTLEARTFLEAAYLALDLYQYHRRWGTEAEQREALVRIVHDRAQARFLPKELQVTAASALLVLEFRSRHYAEADRVWRVLSASATDVELAPFRPLIAELEKLRSGSEPIRTNGVIADRDAWFGRLFRRQFEINVSSGVISEIRLRCERSFVFFRYQPGVRYSVDAADGGCYIQLTGTPGASFDLVES